MNGDWRVWRPAIWLVMLGIAVALLVSPWYISAVFVGAAIGAGSGSVSACARWPPSAERQPQRRRRSGGKR